MKKPMVWMVLVLATLVAVAQSQPGQEQAPGQKLIKDPGEYNAYMSALNMQEPAEKAASMEGFIKQFPGSVVKGEALQQLLAACHRSQESGQDRRNSDSDS